MKKISRYILIGITSIFILGSIGYSTFLISQISNDEGSAIDNTYNVIFHYKDLENATNDLTYTITGLEEDSYFDLPTLNYENKTFNGWSAYESRSSSISLNTINIKFIKDNFEDIIIEDNTLNLYSIINDITDDKVLLRITDNTDSVLTYYLLTDASMFSLFNIRYVYNSTFVEVTISAIQSEPYLINDTVDLSDFGGRTIDVLLSLIETN